MEFSTKDMHVWRMTAAVSWSILFQFMFLCLFIIITTIDVWNFDGFLAPFHSLFSSKCFYIIPLAVVIFFQGIICSRDYLKPPKAHFISQRYLILISLFSYQNMAALFVHILLGFTVSFVYSSLSNDRINSISVRCTSGELNFYDGICLNEKKFFLVLGGIWIGFYTFITDYIFQSRTLNFPPVQQHKFIRMQAAFFSCLKNSTIKAIVPSFLFCMLYYFKGNTPRSYFCSFADFYPPHYLLDTLFTLFDQELMIFLWLFTAMYLLMLDIMVILFNIHLTERAYFPITTYLLPSANKQFLFLQDALAKFDVPIIQHLGFLDLALLSEFDSQRRAELFTLSQPGGHPHSWNAISNECFKVIDKFTEELDKCIGVSQVDEDESYQDFTKPQISDHHCYQHSYRLRNLSVKINRDSESSPATTLQESYERLIKVYQKWLNDKVQAFCKKPVIAYFFGELSEPKIKHLLFQSHPVIWAVESLSFLTCKSLKEDAFGVAQKDLSKTIDSFLHLKNSLDKLQKQSIFIKKSNKLDLVDIQMKNALKFSVKQSIYRIAVYFKDYIKDVNFSSMDVLNQLLNFIDFKEV
ncbi:nuclear division cycle 1 [Lycorma delicatula]|uniref:nuclear division cycle 1 n=1 Tax=Lycorma delicatula TaxID=130591 RepID=UPI003F5128F9